MFPLFLQRRHLQAFLHHFPAHHRVLLHHLIHRNSPLHIQLNVHPFHPRACHRMHRALPLQRVLRRALPADLLQLIPLLLQLLVQLQNHQTRPLLIQLLNLLFSLSWLVRQLCFPRYCRLSFLARLLPRRPRLHPLDTQLMPPNQAQLDDQQTHPPVLQLQFLPQLLLKLHCCQSLL